MIWKKSIKTLTELNQFDNEIHFTIKKCLLETNFTELDLIFVNVLHNAFVWKYWEQFTSGCIANNKKLQPIKRDANTRTHPCSSKEADKKGE